MPLLTMNPWKIKAAALDRYRWKVLRERHGFAGSVFRFCRDAVFDFGFGFLSKLRLTTKAGSKSCDFLLLQSASRIIALRRKKLLISSLQERGYLLVETALPECRQILAERQLMRPPCTVPCRYFGYAAHAAWIVERYRPRILLNDRNGSLYSPFLRLSLNHIGSKLVHLAHATTVEKSRRLGMNDYDYYLLFGPSSLSALQARTLRFGSSVAVLAGSHMIDRSFDLPASEPCQRTILILGVGPDKEKEEGYLRTYQLLKECAEQSPQYRFLVKRHPRSSVPFWQDAADSLKNIFVLSQEWTLAKALGEASTVVNIMSNAVIEAGLAARPVIYTNLSQDRDIFNQESFFGPAMRTLAEFNTRIQEIEQNYSDSISRSRQFALFHLAHGSRGLDTNLEVLEALFRGSALPDDADRVVLPESI